MSKKAVLGLLALMSVFCIGSKFDARVGAPACMMSIYVEIYILHVINNNGRIFDTSF